MLDNIQTPLYFGLAFSILVFLYNITGFYVSKYYKTPIDKVVMLFDISFNFVKISKNEISFILGWLPLGGYLSFKEGQFDDKTILKNRMAVLVMSVLAFLVSGWFIHNDFGFFNDVSVFLKNAVQLATGDISAQTFVAFFDNNGQYKNYFALIFVVVILITSVSSLIELLGIGFLKYLKLLLLTIAFLIYVMVFYKLVGAITIIAVVVFYMSALLSSLLLLFASMIIIKKN